jgi:hypothetical protein
VAVRVSAAVWGAGPRDRTMRYVLLALADHADQSGFAFPSIARLAGKCVLTERSVIGTVTQLEHDNWITKTKKGKANQYQINLEKLGIGPVLDENDSGEIGEQTSRENPSREIHGSPQVKSTASIGEIHCTPPAPPYRSNRQEPSVEPVAGAVDEAVALIVKAEPSLRADAVRRAIAEQLAAEVRKGFSLEDLIERMPASWRKFRAARDSGKFEIHGWGPANFFGGEHWRDEQCWPWRAEYRPEAARRYVDPETLYSGAEYQPRVRP